MLEEQTCPPLMNLLQTPRHWNWKYVTPYEVTKTIDNMSPKSTCGPDGLSMRMIKKVRNGVAHNLARLINTIIVQKTYPEELGIARIKPCYKHKGPKHEEANYRPIAIKKTLAKVVDAMLFGQQLSFHINLHLPDNTFAYRPSRNTEDAVMHLREKILELWEDKKKIACISWDVKSAFTEIPHQLLLDSLLDIGASTAVMGVVQTYLKGQKQFVEVEKCRSKTWKTEHRGISQGSHLAGPAYNIATIGHTAVEDLKISCRYSDDDIEIISANSSRELSLKIKQALLKKKTRVQNTGLTQQTSKTNILLVNCTLDPIEFEGNICVQSNTMKYLGAWLKADLKPQTQVDAVLSKLRSAAARIRSLGMAPPKWKLPTYYAWAQAAVNNNGAAYLPFISKTQTKQLQIALNNALRAAVNAPSRIKDVNGRWRYLSASKLRKKYKIPSVEQLITITTAKWAWKSRIPLNENEQVQAARPGPATRFITKVPAQIVKGRQKLSIMPKCSEIWSRMPSCIKVINNQKKANKLIGRWARGGLSLVGTGIPATT